jgi:hypothetical protein
MKPRTPKEFKDPGDWFPMVDIQHAFCQLTVLLLEELAGGLTS